MNTPTTRGLFAFLIAPWMLGAALSPTELPGLRYTNDFFPGTTYRSNFPAPETLLGFPLGERAATASQVEQCLKTWSAAAPERARLVEYARSHEQRPLHYMVVSAPSNLARIETIRADLARLGDPRQLSPGEADELIQSLPGVAWLAYTIHGDETEGSDAALAVLHHLLAAEDSVVERLLEDLVIVIDPLMNPDGRDRFLQMVAEHRGALPNVDDQSLLHRGYWPYGRGNHYLFDLNRDWIFGLHPETRGRVRAVREWNPQLFVDAHGMGAQETHLFSPPREPINPNIPKGREFWAERFARDQAGAFDRHRLLYYTGEWHEEWYPGYSDAWASYRGAVGILYEQARIAEDAVRRPEGRLLSYRESVRHHVIGTWANLGTQQAHRQALLRFYHETRREAVDPEGPYGKRTFAIPPTPNHGRLRDLIAALRLQGFELFQLSSSLEGVRAVDHSGRVCADLTLPAGTVLVPNRQPLGHLVAALLEFDPRLSPKVLQEEREELLRKGRSRVYDVTTWNLTMLFGLPAYTLPTDLPEGAEPLPSEGSVGLPQPTAARSPVAHILDGNDDRSVTAAARLMERGVQVRVADKPFRLDDRDFARGSIVITPLDNRSSDARWQERVETTATELGLALHAVESGLGHGELPDLGGGHFLRLEPPRLAILTRDRFSITDFGATWFVVDQHLGIRHSHLADIAASDLSRYNVLVVPSSTPGALSTNHVRQLEDWVRNGGTLIAFGPAAGHLATAGATLTKVRQLPDVLGQLAEYEVAVLRQWLADSRSIPPETEVWNRAVPARVSYPWPTTDAAFPDEKELKRRDAWQRLFMPQGAFLASRVDTNHWLTAGCDRTLPVLVGNSPVLMAAEAVEVPIRYGVFVNAKRPSEGPPATAEPDNRETSPANPDTSTTRKKEIPRVGWCVLPPDTELELRMSGLLWPEATHRLAHGAFLTRERVGRGQVILFAAPPAFRASTRGTSRLLLNAIVYGPGCGTAPVVRP
jgi:hypothetical protein